MVLAEPAPRIAPSAGLPPPILEARDLTRVYRLGGTTVEALRDVSLSVQAGEFVALMGPSGSGKSTLLQVLGGLDRPTTGEVVLEGQRINTLSDDKATRLRRDRTGFVFQSFNLIPLLDVTENVALPFTIAGDDPSKGALRERIKDVIDLVDLTGKERHRPDQLSAGEQQRVAIARALVTRPALLFADEPTGNLDYSTSTEILDALWRSCTERGQTIVLVTHDSKAAAYADRVLVVSDGRIRDTIELGRRTDHDATAADRPARPARPVGPRPMALRRLALRSLRARPMRTGASIIAVALGVAVLFAGLATQAGIQASVDETVRILMGRADLRIEAFDETGLSPRPWPRSPRHPASTSPLRPWSSGPTSVRARTTQRCPRPSRCSASTPRPTPPFTTCCSRRARR